MPKKGYKSITVKEEVHAYFKEQFEKMKTEKKLKEGVTSFSGWVSHILYELMQQEMKRNP